MSLNFLLVVGFCIAKSNNFECDIAVTLHQETLHEHDANQSHISTIRILFSIMQGGLKHNTCINPSKTLWYCTILLYFGIVVGTIYKLG